MANDDRSIRVRLIAEIGQYRDGMKQAVAATTEFGKNVSGHGAAVTKDVRAVGQASLLMAGAVGVGMGMAVKSAMDWETAWAGVTKTVSGSKSQMSDLEDGLRGLATTLPASHKEIAGVAEAAGQLGIQRDAIVGFTKTMVDLGVSTNLTADQAATGIAKIMNVMGTSQADVGRFGATLVALGNVGASTETEILEMAQRLSGAGKLVGASESDVLALANAMSSMGIEAQLGGGAFSRVMLQIYSAVKSGGDKLQGFAKVAGLSATDFSDKFGKDPIRTIDTFVKGLDRIDKSGGNVIAALSGVGISGTQNLQVLLRLKGAGDLLTQSLDLGSKAWLDNTALTNEANKRYETTASKLAVLRNKVSDVGIDLGGVLLPALKGTTDMLGRMVAGFGSLPGPAKDAAMGIGGIATAGLGLIGVVGTFGPNLEAGIKALSQMGSIGSFVAGNIGTIGSVLGIATVAFGIYSIAAGNAAQKNAEAAAQADRYTQAIIDQGSEIGHQTDAMYLEKVVAGDVGKALRDAGSDMSVLTDAMHATGSSGKDMRKDLDDLETGLHNGFGMDNFIDMLGEGKLKGSELSKELLELANSGDISAGAMARLLARLREQNADWNTGIEGAKDKAAADKALAENADAATGPTDKLTKALKAQAESAADAAKEIKAIADAEHAAIDPLFGMLDATKSNADARKALTDALAEGGHTTEELTALQEAAAKSALDMNGAAITLAGSIAAGTVNVDVAKAMLGEWVTQGLITKDTAIQMGIQFDAAATKANTLAGPKITTLRVDDQTTPTLDAIAAKLRGLGALIRTTPISNPILYGIPGASNTVQRSEGGFVGTHQDVGGAAGSGPFRSGPKGSDTIPAWLTPGEFVIKSSAALALGPSTLHALNSGQSGAASGFARLTAPPSSGTNIYVTVPVQVAGSVHSKESLARAVEGSVSKSLRTNSGFKATVKAAVR